MCEISYCRINCRNVRTNHLHCCICEEINFSSYDIERRNTKISGERAFRSRQNCNIIYYASKGRCTSKGRCCCVKLYDKCDSSLGALLTPQQCRGYYSLQLASTSIYKLLDYDQSDLMIGLD